METTEGLGRNAEVWVGGDLLKVCDGVSEPGTPCPPGVLEGVRFHYLSMVGFSWNDAVRGNASRKTLLDPVRSWSYTGYGCVLSVQPVVVDFGVLTMEDSNWTTDERLVGRFVQIPIDRLEIGHQSDSDWPEGAR